MKTQNKFTVQKLAVVGLMAARVYVATNFRIDIPTPMGKTMLHLGNVMCILSGLLFGGPVGGLAAGIGSAFFDLLDPTFAPGFMVTFVMKFCLGFTAGAIAHSKGHFGENKKLNLIGAISGAVLYVALYVTKTFVTSYFIVGEHLEAVMSVVLVKGSVSLVNGIIAVIVSIILATAIIPQLRSTQIFKKVAGQGQ